MKLLIDLGNTRLKWALWDRTGLQPSVAVVTAAVNDDDGVLDRLDALWKDIPGIDSIWIASVAAPALEQALAHRALARFGVDAQFVRSCAQAGGVRNAYAQPERLGVDRFLGLIAAHAQAQEPTVIANCGTALALDALAADGTHLGGLIAPSPALMQIALHTGTARLGERGRAHIVELADNTADAVESGTWLAAVALIERFFARSAERLNSAPALILAGGAAPRLAELVALPYRIDAELVLRGLARFAESGT